MNVQNLAYNDADGRTYVGLLAAPERPRGPAVLVAPGAPGLDDHTRTSARRLAELGYMALAVDYHGGGRALTREEMPARLEPLFADTAGLRAPMLAALAALAARPGVDPARIAAIGYCFGGCASLELARAGADVKGALGFHATLPTGRPEEYRNIKGPVLLLQGSADPIVPLDRYAAFAAAMNEAGADWRVVLYGGAQHAFTMQDAARFGQAGIAYHQPTAERAWEDMLAFLAETIGQPQPA